MKKKDNNFDAGDSKTSKKRRKLLVSGGIAAAGITQIPTQWSKPVLQTVVVPTHARTSMCPPGKILKNIPCPPTPPSPGPTPPQKPCFDCFPAPPDTD